MKHFRRDARSLVSVPKATPGVPWLAVGIVAFALTSAAPARAQVFGQFTPAAVLEQGQHTVGAYGLFADRSWGALGVGRAGIGRGLEVGGSLGFVSHEDSPAAEGPNTLLLAGDIRYQIRWAQPDAPVDASVGLGLGFESGKDYTRRSIAPQALASHRISYGGGSRAVTPYGSILLEYENLDIPGASDSDLDLRARIGGMWEPSSKLGLSAELTFGGEVVFGAGARWPF